MHTVVFPKQSFFDLQVHVPQMITLFSFAPEQALSGRNFKFSSYTYLLVWNKDPMSIPALFSVFVSRKMTCKNAEKFDVPQMVIIRGYLLRCLGTYMFYEECCSISCCWGITQSTKLSEKLSEMKYIPNKGVLRLLGNGTMREWGSKVRFFCVKYIIICFIQSMQLTIITKW